MGDVFISYSRRDTPFVRKLHEALVGQRFDVYVDWEDIPSWSPDYEAELYAAIDGSDTFVFVLSPESLTSQNCALEVDHAAASGKRIKPLLRRPPNGVPIPEPLRRPQWTRFEDDHDFDQALDELTGALRTDVPWVRVHTQLLQASAEWEARDFDRSQLLHGKKLRQAEGWLAVKAGKDPPPTKQQIDYIGASRRATRRRLQATLVAVSVALVVAVALAVVALAQRSQAVEQASISRSRELAATSLLRGPDEPLAGLRLARDAAAAARTSQAEDALRAALASPIRADLRGHVGEVSSARYSRDGRAIVTAGLDHTARVWDPASGRTLHVLRGHRDFVNDAEFSPDGRLVATASWDKTAALWDVASGRRVGLLRGHSESVSGVRFSPDGKLVATFSDDDTARLWSVPDGRRVAVLAGHADDLQSLAFDPDGRRIVTGSSDGTARVSAVPSGRLLYTRRAGKGIVFDAAFSPDGRRFVTAVTPGGFGRSRIGVWESRSGSKIVERSVPDDLLTHVEFSPDGLTILAAGDHAPPRLWDLSNGHSRVLATRGGLTVARFSPDGRLVVTAGDDARIFDPGTGQQLMRIDAGTGTMQDVSFSPSGQTLVSAGSDGVARVWSTGARLIPLDHGTLGAIAFSHDGERLVTATKRGDVTVRDVASGSVLARERLGARTDSLGSPDPFLSFSPDGQRVYASLGDGTARIWEPGGGVPVVARRIGADTFGMLVELPGVISPDGGRVGMRGDDARIRDLRTGRESVLHGGKDAEILSVAFDPAGRRVATAGWDHSARIWEASSGKLLRAIRGFRDIVQDAEFSPDGRRLVTASREGTARIWDVSNGRRLGELRGHTDWVTRAQFSADGRFVVSESNDRSVRIWDARSGRSVLRLPWFGVAALAPDDGHVALVKDGFDAVVLYPCEGCAGWNELRRRAAARLDGLAA